MRTFGFGRRLPRGASAACVQGVLTFGGVLLAAQPPSPAPQSAPALSAPRPLYESLFACPTTLDHIGRVVIPVRVDGRGPFRFVVDTGASHSTVSPGLVRALGLVVSKVPLIDLEGVTGSAAVPAVKIKTLRAGSLVIRNMAVPVLTTPMMAGADGILGIAGIRNITLLVNFQQNRVRIGRALTGDIRFDFTRVHTLSVAGGLMAIPAYVGDVRALAIIDTGSERSLGNIALRNALHAHPSGGKLEPVTAVYGATRQIEMGRMAASPMIAAGPLRVAGVDLIYGNFHIFKVWNLEKRPAMIIGMDVLGTIHALGFDFPRHDLFVSGVRPGSSNSFPNIQTMLGPGGSETPAKVH